MHDTLRSSIDDLFPATTARLEDLIRIPSVSADGYDPAEVRRSAEATASFFVEAGVADARVVDVDGGHPAVFGHVPAPPGSPTVLLYAHHDVQPPGSRADWTTGPFEPVHRTGRLYGRGSSDDKAGIVTHLAALHAHEGRPPVGIKVLIEGEEEIGSPNLAEFLGRHAEMLAADVIVIADAGNWRTGQPAFTTSLRGLVDCVVEVRTLDYAVHSGGYGGALPDAITTLVRLLARLHDDAGNVAVPGLVSRDADPFDLTEEELRRQAGAVPGLHLIGTGTLTSRLWTRPAISILGIDAPPVQGTVNALTPVARAKVSMRIAPGDDPEVALDALTAHLERHAPWGARVAVHRGEGGRPFTLDTSGPAYDAWRTGMAAAWGRDAVEVGVGGSIPFVAAFAETYPDASILLVGAGDDRSRAHGPDESVDLDDLRRCGLAEAIALAELAS